MTRLPRALGPAALALVFAAMIPASAWAASTVTFPEGMPPETTVSIVDPGSSSPTVHLTVTAANPTDLSKTKVLLGGGSYVYDVIGTDGVHEVEDEFEDVYGSDCVVHPTAARADAPVTVAGASFSADLPKGEVIAFDTADVAAVVTGPGTQCTAQGHTGIAVDFLTDAQEVDGFSWAAPATPAVVPDGGRRQFTLNFTQETGTSYELWRVVDGVREATPLRANLRGTTGDTQFVIDMDDDGNSLPADTKYALQLRAVRQFTVRGNAGLSDPSSGYSTFTVATKPVQKVTMLGAPTATTTARTANFTWFITAALAGDVTSCWLDVDGPAATEVPCTASGASLSGLSLGAHTLTVYPADGETSHTATWTVVAETTPPLPPTVPAPPTAPKPNPNDVDGDGIETTWLVGGKPAAAPKTPKVAVSGTRVKLTLAPAPKGAKSVRVYRTDGKGTYTLVKTLKASSKTFTDTKVKAGKTYRYKTVAVNAKGQQGKASGAVSAKVKKK
jgi:hypothetical protein